MKTESPLSPEFIKAVNDYYYLMKMEYPEKGSLKLVGDRYRLSTDIRTILYRGISSPQKVESRKQRIIINCPDTISIDGYNVLFTLLNYRLGRIVFLSNDGICRDAGSLFGKVPDAKLFNDCVFLLIDYLGNSVESDVRIYLDSPVKSSPEHQDLLYKTAKSKGLPIKIILTKSADQSLLDDPSGIIASSDSAIIDRTEKMILDIPKYLLLHRYHAELLNLEALLR